MKIIFLLTLLTGYFASVSSFSLIRKINRSNFQAFGKDEKKSGETYSALSALNEGPGLLLLCSAFSFAILTAASNAQSISFPNPFSEYPKYGKEEIMAQKSHGTSNLPVQSKLRWNCDVKLADRICNFNRRWAEYAGYWNSETTFLKEIQEEDVKEITFYDSVTGKPLFIAPKGRSMVDFIAESRQHGWPSFRDNEVVWENVRCLNDGETVSLTGTHLGHNLPDMTGNRYCINLVSVAGYPIADGNRE